MKPDGIPVIDSREQRPDPFERGVRKALGAGDYSIENFEDRVAIERKTKTDAYQSIGRNRKRLVRELERLAEMDFAAIVIECSMSSFLEPPQYSSMHPNAAFNSLVAWAIRYGIHVFFADNRQLGYKITRELLEKFWNEQNN